MDRADAISVIKDIHAEMEDARDNIAVEALDIAIKEIERPRGEWIIDEEWITPTNNPTDDYKVTTYTCQFCGRVENEYFDYCHCGAKIVKEEGDEE